MPSSARPDRLDCARPIATRCLQTMLRLLPILLLAACAQQAGYGPGGRPYVEIGADGWRRPTHYYQPPGPPEDPWGPYIREAAARHRVPERWVRAVMHQESGGQEQATSPVGAMGLMQVMPATYEELRARHRLGDDPYDPHNNILAGTAYIREMYDRYGAPGFLAAYNAGPDRVDRYLAGTAILPDETVNYLAAITPNLGNPTPRSGPFAVYASARSGRATRFTPSVASLAAGCDLNAAYNPNHPCTSLEQAAVQSAPNQPALVRQAGADGCDLNAAYNPNHPCTSLVQAAASSAPTRQALVQEAAVRGCDLNTAYDPSHPCASTAQPAGSGVQVASAAGCDPNAAFNPDRPCQAATMARQALLPPAPAQRVPAATSAAVYQTTTPPSQQRPSRSAMPGGASPSPTATVGGGWGIQVGAFANPGLARAVAEGARAQAPDQLRSAALAFPPTAPFGSKVLYRARLVHLSASAASNACTRLNQRQLPCVVVPPTGS
jgi:D-alanyl-D-alanine carboxypeptidase